MNATKADAIAHLAKWFDKGTEVRATHTTVTGRLYVIGKITELSDAAIKVTGKNCEVLLYFRSTSEYSYEDTRMLPTEANKDRINKYPTVMDIKFGNGDRLEILQFFSGDERLRVPQGEFELARYPTRANEKLRAWDAADEFLLRHLASRSEAIDAADEILIVNDSWGALSAALADHHPLTVSDSYLSHAATHQNLARNALDVSAVRPLASFDPLPASIDVVVMKIPKSLALLEDQLHRIAPHIHEKTVFIAGAMTKHIHTSTLELFANIVGPTRTSLAERKARLIFCEPDPALERPRNPWPKAYTVGNNVVTSHAGVFSASRLDSGAGFLLSHFKQPAGPLRVVDLGCGNGILGMRTAFSNPEAEVTFIDESYRAVASAEATFRANLGPERTARFLVGNGVFDVANGAPLPRGSIDRVLNNPPFHENHAIGDATAWQMFTESCDVLQPGGELWVVGNRHLAYHAKLKRLFGKCDLVASDARFVVLRASRAEGPP